MRSVFLLVLIATASCTAADEGVAGTPFTVWVLERSSSTVQPLVDVTVAFDPPSGERVVSRTTADGHVTFEGDFTRGGGAVTVLSEGHVYLTMLEASPDTASARPNLVGKPPIDLVVFPKRLDASAEKKTVELRGRLSGKASVETVVTVAVSGVPRLGRFEAIESAYALRAPRDRPFLLLGHETRTLVDASNQVTESELVRSFRLDLPPRGDDQLLDLDVAKLPTLPSRIVSTRVELPEAKALAEGVRAFVSVGSADSELDVGLFTRARATAEGRAVDVDVTVVDTDVAPERLVTRALLRGADGSQSRRSEPGPLRDNAVWKDFPAPPEVPDPDAPRTIRDAIPLSGFPRGAELVAEVFAGGQLLWELHGPPGGPTGAAFTIPYRDEIANASVQIFALTLTARSDAVPLPGGGEIHRKSATSRDIQLRKR